MKISEIKTQQDALKIYKNDILFRKCLRINNSFFEKIISKFEKSIKIDIETKRDLKQECAFSFWKALKNYDINRASFSTFVWKCIRNDLALYLNKKRKSECEELISSHIDNVVDCDYDDNFESYVYNNSKKTNLYQYNKTQNEIIDYCDRRKSFKKMHNIHKKIFLYKEKQLSRNEIAKKLNINLHTYKFILYNSYIPKIKKIFGENYQQVTLKKWW